MEAPEQTPQPSAKTSPVTSPRASMENPQIQEPSTSESPQNTTTTDSKTTSVSAAPTPALEEAPVQYDEDDFVLSYNKYYEVCEFMCFEGSFKMLWKSPITVKNETLLKYFCADCKLRKHTAILEFKNRRFLQHPRFPKNLHKCDFKRRSDIPTFLKNREKNFTVRPPPPPVRAPKPKTKTPGYQYAHIPNSPTIPFSKKRREKLFAELGL